MCISFIKIRIFIYDDTQQRCKLQTHSLVGFNTCATVRRDSRNFKLDPQQPDRIRWNRANKRTRAARVRDRDAAGRDPGDAHAHGAIYAGAYLHGVLSGLTWPAPVRPVLRALSFVGRPPGPAIQPRGFLLRGRGSFFSL